MPHIKKQTVREIIETLDAYGVGAHHPDLLALLDRPEQNPIAWMNPDDLCADTAFRWCKLDVFTDPIYTHPPAPLKMLSDDEFTEVSCHISSGRDAIKAFCDKNGLALEKL